MYETDFKTYSQHFKGANFRNPGALASAPVPIRRILIIGSCLASTMKDTCRYPSDFILFNGGVLPPAPQSLSAYDFQIVQIPLRIILHDADLWHLAYNQKERFDQALNTAVQRLNLFFDQYLKYHGMAGLPAFVTNLMVPTQNPNGKLFPFFDLRNVQFFIMNLNMALEHLCRQRTACYVLDVDNIANTHGKRFITDESLGWYSHGATFPVLMDGVDGSRVEQTPHTCEHYGAAQQ